MATNGQDSEDEPCHRCERDRETRRLKDESNGCEIRLCEECYILFNNFLKGHGDDALLNPGTEEA